MIIIYIYISPHLNWLLPPFIDLHITSPHQPT